MIILALNTSSPLSELYIYDGQKMLSTHTWEAGRDLSVNLLSTIRDTLGLLSLSLQDIEGIVVYKGPGSFTGLRIGVTVANTLAYALGVPIIGVSGETWAQDGVEKLGAGVDDSVVLPEYGSEPHITL